MWGHGGELQNSEPCYATRAGEFPKHTAMWAQYKVLKPLEGYNLANMIPFDRNWGRSTNWFPLFTDGYQPQFVQDAQTPSVPFAHYRETDFQHVSHEPYTDPYEHDSAVVFYTPPTPVRNY